MNSPASNIVATFAAVICCAGVTPTIAAAPESSVLAQDLEQVRSSGRLLSALWTRRSGAYTVQIVFPDPMAYLMTPENRLKREPEDSTRPRPATSSHQQIAETQVWLLAKDGSAINPFSISGKTGRVPSRSLKIASLRYLGETPVEVQYSFPLSAGPDAVAVAVMLDGKLFIDKLSPLEAETR